MFRETNLISVFSGYSRQKSNPPKAERLHEIARFTRAKQNRQQ